VIRFQGKRAHAAQLVPERERGDNFSIPAAGTTLTGVQWRYLKVPQKQFEQLQAATLADLVVTSGSLL
jgi:hypothetical protein